MAKKPLIGLSPLYDTKAGNMWMLDAYMAGIEAAGGIPLMLSVNARGADADQILEGLDGFLFPGGQDLFPMSYGEPVHPASGAICPRLDQLEWMLVEKARKRRLPVLGICRGIQLLNVALGGTLYQDLPSQWTGSTAILHRQSGRIPDDSPIHSVSLEPDSLLARALGKQELLVNSFHHPAIKDLAPSLRVAATAPDGLVEGVEAREGAFLLAVQWHPELLFHRDPDAAGIFRLFVDHCREGSAQ